MENLSEPRLITFASIADPRGNLCFIQPDGKLPFEIRRVYWTYDVPSWRIRHGRALHKCAELILATSGQCTVTVDGGDGRKTAFTLNRSNVGLLIPPMTWRTIDGFVTGTTCLTVASELYDEADYIYDYSEFLKARSDEQR